MNDDFLRKHRQAPPKAFADDLYRQLQEEQDDMATLPMTRAHARRAPFPIGAAALFALLFVSVIFALRGNNSPPPLTQIDTSFFDTLQPITAENAAQLTEIARLGSGTVSDVAWDNDVIALGGSLGVWLVDATDISAAPRLLAGNQTMYHRSVTLVDNLVAAPDGDTVRVWDVTTGEEVAAFSESGKHWWFAALSPDGRYVAGAESTGFFERRQWTLNVWDVTTGEIVYARRERQPYLSLAFNPMRLYQFAAQTAAGVYLYDLDQPDVEITVDSKETADNLDVGLVYSPDGGKLAFSTPTGAILWNVTEHVVEQEIVISNDTTPYLTDLAFSADGMYLALASRNYGITLWNVALQSWINGAPRQSESFRAVSMLAFNNALEAPTIAAINYISTLELFTVDTTAPFASVRHFNSPFYLADLNADDRAVAASGIDGQIHLWDVQTGQETRVIDSRRAPLTDLAFSADGSTLAVAGNVRRYAPEDNVFYSNIQLFDSNTGALVHGYGDTSTQYFRLAFSPDGANLIASAANDTVEMWSLAESEPNTLGAVFIRSARVEMLRYSPDNTLLGMLTTDGRLSFFDAATGAERFPLAEAPNRIGSFAFSADGTKLALGQRLASVDSYISIHDLTTGAEIARIEYETNTDLVKSLTFSPDSTLIAAVVDENRLHVWDTATGELLFDHGDNYLLNQWLMWSSDGRMIISADWDGLIRLWGIPE